MSQTQDVPVARPDGGRRSVLGGIGVGLLGHVLAIAAVYGLAALIGGDSSGVELDSGGRLGAFLGILAMYFVAQLVLLGGLLLLGAYTGRRFGAGLNAGWVGGVALIAGYVCAWYNLNRP